MKIIGIVSEYNPFHLGHRYHITESRKIAGGETAVVCVMSGDFVQRGEAAIFSKYARAEAAVKAGADLVLELPLPWCVSSAEGFARGAVGLLGALNCVDYLSFGSESGDIPGMSAVATALMEPSTDREILEELKTGVSYPAARHAALKKSLGGLADLLETPNNILAIEYLKAIFDLRLRLAPITVVRKGAGHDSEGGSASDIRDILKRGGSPSRYLPREVEKICKREHEQGRGPVFMDHLEGAMLSRLRMLDEQAFAQIPDDSEGLGNRLFTAAHEESTLDGVLAAAKTKRYTLSRLRRMCLFAALGIERGMADELPPYARVLAFNEAGRTVLREISDKASIPVITKPAHVKELNAACLSVFELTSAAHDFYVLGYSAKEERWGRADWRTGPVVL